MATASMTKAITRIVHANPILGRSCWTMAGNTIPPVALPDAAMPRASALLVEKYVESNDTVLCNDQSHASSFDRWNLRAEEESISKTRTDPLSQKQMPVLGRERGHEDTNKLQYGAGPEYGTEIASIRQTAREGANEEQ